MRLGYKSAVVRTPDTDICFILMHCAHSIELTIYVDTGTGKHRRLVNISELAQTQGEAFCTSLLGLHVFTGEDVTSAFKGKGKIVPLRKLQCYPKYQDAIRSVVTYSIYKWNFVFLIIFCLFMYIFYM